METQTPFNLVAAIQNWRRELVAQPGVKPEDCRELEAHLNDSIAQLHKLGLVEEEAFWLGRRRLGGSQEISQELIKEDPDKLWRDRILWVTVVLLGLQLWRAICASLTSPLTLIAAMHKSVPPWLDALTQIHQYGGSLALYVVPVIWFAIQVRRGRMEWFLSTWQFLCASRMRFLRVSIPLVLCLSACQSLWILGLSHGYRGFWYTSLLNGIVPLGMVGFIVWLIPERAKQEPDFAN